jgi:hypothetical protein
VRCRSSCLRIAETEKDRIVAQPTPGGGPQASVRG